MTIPALYQIYLQYPSIQTDTRRLKKGDLFFALKGPSFNGNQFAIQALEQGAAFAVVDEPVDSDRAILVDDVLATLQALALHHRRGFNIPFIAITGSNGKTTTKELIHAVLSSTYKVYTTQGNLNNHIGVPLTLLSIGADAEFAVIEMGANHLREIAGYCTYTLPTHGLITNIGKAHLEGFGGPEGVKKGKGELFDFLRDHKEGGEGSAFVMWDDEVLRELSKGIPHVITYGTKDADYCGVMISSPTFLGVDIQKGPPLTPVRIRTQLVGDYNLPNVLAAFAVGSHFGVPEDKIQKAIAQYTPSNSRSQLIEKDGNHIILDAYNANPSSMRAAIENFARMQVGDIGAGGAGGQRPPKILILGAMAELGAESLREHEQIIELIGRYPWQHVLLVGGDFQKADHPWLRFDDARGAADWLRNAHRQGHLQGAYILVKGSRSMKMEDVLA